MHIRAIVLCTTVVLTTWIATRGFAQDHSEQSSRAVRYLHRRVIVHGDTMSIHAVIIDLCDRSVEMRMTAPSERGQTVSAWAHEISATAAVNGDYFDGSTMAPLGPTRGHGEWWPDSRRMHRDALFATGGDIAPEIMDALGPGEMWHQAQQRITSEHSEVMPVRERILVAGNIRESPWIIHPRGRHPRTALGLSADRHTLIMLVIDGRSENSSGATVLELAGVLRDLGANEGMKLDGGGSSAMYIEGHGVVNHPSDGRERVVANHIGVIVHAERVGERPWCR